MKRPQSENAVFSIARTSAKKRNVLCFQFTVVFPIWTSPVRIRSPAPHPPQNQYSPGIVFVRRDPYDSTRLHPRERSNLAFSPFSGFLYDDSRAWGSLVTLVGVRFCVGCRMV